MEKINIKQTKYPLFSNSIVAIRGGGDVATGVIQKFWRSGFKVVILETAAPLAIRRTVSLCSSVWSGEYTVEDMTAIRIETENECGNIWAKEQIPVLIDPMAKSLKFFKPMILIDAIIAKKNYGTNKTMAPITIALGPGFSAPDEVDAIIETMRGHSLGQIITKGQALANTGIPGELGGKTAERVVHTPVSGMVTHVKKIGDQVIKGETIFLVDNTPVPSPLDGTLRGLIAEGAVVKQGLKCADVDPRAKEAVDYMTISDKARSIGGATLEAALYLSRIKNIQL